MSRLAESNRTLRQDPQFGLKLVVGAAGLVGARFLIPAALSLGILFCTLRNAYSKRPAPTPVQEFGEELGYGFVSLGACIAYYLPALLVMCFWLMPQMDGMRNQLLGGMVMTVLGMAATLMGLVGSAFALMGLSHYAETGRPGSLFEVRLIAARCGEMLTSYLPLVCGWALVPAALGALAAPLHRFLGDGLLLQIPLAFIAFYCYQVMADCMGTLYGDRYPARREGADAPLLKPPPDPLAIKRAAPSAPAAPVATLDVPTGDESALELKRIRDKDGGWD